MVGWCGGVCGYWPTDWLAGGCGGWLTGWLTDWLTGMLAGWLTDWLDGTSEPHHAQTTSSMKQHIIHQPHHTYHMSSSKQHIIDITYHTTSLTSYTHHIIRYGLAYVHRLMFQNLEICFEHVSNALTIALPPKHIYELMQLNRIEQWWCTH